VVAAGAQLSAEADVGEDVAVGAEGGEDGVHGGEASPVGGRRWLRVIPAPRGALGGYPWNDFRGAFGGARGLFHSQ
jgi:hypothetical protein